MTQHRQSGKINIVGLLMIVVVFYIGFVVVKIISANMTKSQIKTSIINDIGQIRGPELTVEACENVIWNVLISNGISEYGDEVPDADGKTTVDKSTATSGVPVYPGPQMDVTINKKDSTVHFRVTYRHINNLLLFKQKKIFEVEGDVQNYN